MANTTISYAFTDDNDKKPSNETIVVFVRWQHLDWIIPEVINVTLIMLTSWILISLIFFGVKTKKWKQGRKNNFEKLSGGSVLTAAVICAVVTMCRLITSQFVNNVGYAEGQDEACEMAIDTGIIMYCMTLFSVYIFLWLRQSVFYTNSMLNTEFSKILRFFSWLSIGLIFLGGLSAVLINTVPVNYPSSIEGCIYEAVDSTFDAILVAVCVLVLLTGQITLVGLFVYPLQKRSNQECFSCAVEESENPHKKSEKSVPEAASAVEQLNEQCEKSRQNRHKSKINRILRRSVVFAAIAIVTDVCFIIITTYALDTTHRRIPTTLYDVSACLNLIFVVSSFICWKKILTSPLQTLSTYPSTTNQSSSGLM